MQVISATQGSSVAAGGCLYALVPSELTINYPAELRMERRQVWMVSYVGVYSLLLNSHTPCELSTTLPPVTISDCLKPVRHGPMPPEALKSLPTLSVNGDKLG
ncbi:hypothetical protein GX48_02396 [Paracoccidioides brasiliensis]|nr:hypothetical protein GX48_02396 [Paracoccidioides brasiliensis]